MRALVTTPNGPEPAEIREVEDPRPRPGDAVIEVRAVSLNRGELRQLAAYADWVPGQDVAGVVRRAAADGSGPPAGTRVAALVDEGGWAERVAAPVSRIGALPDNVAFGAAAGHSAAGQSTVRTAFPLTCRSRSAAAARPSSCQLTSSPISGRSRPSPTSRAR